MDEDTHTPYWLGEVLVTSYVPLTEGWNCETFQHALQTYWRWQIHESSSICSHEQGLNRWFGWNHYIYATVRNVSGGY